MPSGQETAVDQRRAKLCRRGTHRGYQRTSTFITSFLQQQLRARSMVGRPPVIGSYDGVS